MWVRASHNGAFIFKDLHPIVLDTQFSSLLNPSAKLCVIQLLSHDHRDVGDVKSLLLINDGLDFFYAHQWDR
jgi:ribonuclease D